MQIVVLKYLQVLCVTIFFSNNIICDNIVISREQHNINKISACAAAKCLSNGTLESQFQKCYNYCLNEVDELPEVNQITRNVTFQLHCRDSSRLVLKINNDHHHVDNASLVYLVTLHRTKEPYSQVIYLTNDTIIVIENLTISMSYNVSVTAVSSNYEFIVMGKKTFTTLKEDYKPENITDMELEYKINENTNQSLFAILKWKPVRDATCLYEVVIHSQGETDDTSPRSYEVTSFNDFYYYLIPMEMRMGENYAIAVRGVNTKIKSLESTLIWKEIETPTCLDLFRSLEICPPDEIQTIDHNETLLRDNTYNLTISWDLPKYKPDYYTIRIDDLEKSYEDRLVGLHNVSGNQNYANFPRIHLEGFIFEVTINAYSKGGIQENIFSHLQIDKDLFKAPSSNKLTIVLYCIFSVACCLSIFTALFIYKRRMDLKKIDELQIQSFDMMLKKSKIENFNELFAIFDDPLEIPRNKIKVLEPLGEGAFGVVKKGYLDYFNGVGMQEVAIKMLKENASFTDIRQFRLEIDMMKSVRKHPNIVSMIGHSTKNIEELMLITEYCDRGNLLDLLKAERCKRNEIAFPITESTSPEYVLNLNTEFNKKVTSYKKNFCEPRHYSTTHSSVFQKIFGANSDSNNNSANENSFKPICAMNPLYLESEALLSLESRQEIPQNNLITVDELMSFAVQVADGMHFLSKQKIIHRDLAARNILCCSNKTVKIADFGLSRQDNLYKKTSSGKLPLKWLAIECMTHQVYTTQSDIWSFGILLYEIVTLGGTPYPSLDPSILLPALQDGYRMEKPKHCGPALYDLMLCCWNKNPKDRPNFKKLVLRLQDICKSETDIIDLESMFKGDIYIASSIGYDKNVI